MVEPPPTTLVTICVITHGVDVTDPGGVRVILGVGVLDLIKLLITQTVFVGVLIGAVGCGLAVGVIVGVDVMVPVTVIVGVGVGVSALAFLIP